MRCGESVGRFIVLEELPRAPELYAAYDTLLDRRVALELSGERLLDGARAAARVSHPSVVAVHDVGEHEGRVFVAMEHVDGVPFDEWLARRPPAAAIRDALAAAGQALLAARDAGLGGGLRSADVLVGRDGRARVVVSALAAGDPFTALEALARHAGVALPAARSLEELLAALGRARRRRIAAIFALGLAVVAAAAATWVRASSPPCATAAAPFWDDAQRGRLGAAFARGAAPFGAASFAATARALDARAAAWSAMRLEVCEATRVRGEQSDEVHDLRVACLDGRRAELATVVERLLVSPAVAELGPRAAAALTPLDGCAASRVLAAAAHKDRRSAVVLEAQLGVARGLRAAGDEAGGAVLARAVAVAGRALGERALEAWALLELPDATAALRVAEASREDHAAARAWLRLALEAGGEPALRAADFAVAAAERLRGDPELRPAAQRVRALALAGLGRDAEARPGLERALAAELAEGAPGRLRAARTMIELAALEARLGEAARAARLSAEAARLLEEIFGAGHPDLSLPPGRIAATLRLR